MTNAGRSQSAEQYLGRIGRTVSESEDYWPPEPDLSSLPNVLLILLDDVGFAQLGCYGSDIATPNIDRLAAEGLRYTNFHTTALCSPTRASLLTGRNPHSVGFGHIVERAAGFPGYNARLPDSAATIAEILRGAGYSTWAIGKWHLVPSYEAGPGGPFDRWPIGRGFDRFYGFLGGSTDQYFPELYRDNTPAQPPRSPDEGYHLTADLVDEAIERVRELRGVAPNRPFFLYLAPGACHAPHQAPGDYIDRYRGQFDDGWDAARIRTLQRQRALGVVPPATELGPPNPGVAAWDTLPEDERRLYSRMMEVYAGMLTHTDAEIGRLLDFLAKNGDLDNSIVFLLSDNGASAEGGAEGSLDEALYFNDMPQRARDALEHIEELGGPRFYNHYPWGWAQAGNTPFRWYKQFTHAGGITNGCIVRWPGGIDTAGGIRDQYHHVIDVVPTILEELGLAVPASVNGVAQQEIHGMSMGYSFHDPQAAERRLSQHYEMWGNRGMWHQGWMAVSRLHPDAPGAWPPAVGPEDISELSWELYNHREDPAERRDLAPSNPAKLQELVDLWWATAGQYQVLPLDTRPRSQRWSRQPQPPGADPQVSNFLGPSGPYERGVAPKTAGRSFRVSAEIECGAGDRPEGVLYALGGVHGGYTWYLTADELVFEVNLMSIRREAVRTPITLSAGQHRLELQVLADTSLAGQVSMRLDGAELCRGEVSQLLKIAPIGSGRTCIGFDPAPSVSEAYVSPFRFTGILNRLTVTTSDPSPTDSGAEAAAEFRSQ